MAQQALPPGAVRRRAMFGLLDADGWGYATMKAGWWFLFIIFMLGYIPNLAYYFTVSNTVKVGYNFLSVVNWCPNGNATLPCPAPIGAVVPWQTSPSELALPAGLSGAVAVPSGTHLYLVGGRTAAGVIGDVSETVVSDSGNFAAWAAGPALPAPRADAAFAALSGVPYIIGGLDASGKPTDTVYVGTVENGQLTGWSLADGTNGTIDLHLPVAVSGASAVASPNGLYVFGGKTADGISNQVISSIQTTTLPVQLQPWKSLDPIPLPEPRAAASAVIIGNSIYVVGGLGPNGATSSIYRLTLASGVPAVDASTGQDMPWAIAPASQELPSARSSTAGFTANGSLYIIGGTDASGAPLSDMLWSIPATSGDLGPWQQLDETQLPSPRTAAAIAPIGSYAFLIGGDGGSGPVADSFRANISPAPPYFQLGLMGATIPALSIKGEIGQQLGYINAMTVGIVNFVVLILIGLAFSHRRQTLKLFEKVSRGRFRAPPEDEYTPSV